MNWTRAAMWRHAGGGVEHAHVVVDGSGVVVDGVLVRPGAAPGEERRVRYTLHCDAGWRVQSVDVDAPEDGTALALHADGAGSWRDGAGVALAHLDGCIDVDLMGVAFTNTLPVRRLGMAVGESHLLAVAFVRLPSMEVVRAEQRYTRLAGDVYRYESVSSGFRADLRIDAEGLVVDYPGLATRMWTE